LRVEKECPVSFYSLARFDLEMFWFENDLRIILFMGTVQKGCPGSFHGMVRFRNWYRYKIAVFVYRKAAWVVFMQWFGLENVKKLLCLGREKLPGQIS
jgi:hypothetical protein